MERLDLEKVIFRKQVPSDCRGFVTGRYVGEREWCIYLYMMCVYRNVFTRTYMCESTSANFLRPFQVTTGCKPFPLS